MDAICCARPQIKFREDPLRELTSQQETLLRGLITLINQWGTNMFPVHEDELRKHRGIIIVAPAFNTKLRVPLFMNDSISLQISDQGTRTYGLKALPYAVECRPRKVGQTSRVVDVPIVQRLRYNVALLMIMKCGFGLKCGWSVPSQARDGSMSIHESIHVTANHMVINFIMSVPLPK